MSIYNLRHAAFTEFFEDFVMRNGLTNHWLPRILLVKSADLNAFEEVGFVNFQR